MDYRDFLSDLPSSIIHMILALVPIKEAVRTSILSRQWRYTWASLPRLSFAEYSPGAGLVGKYNQRLENFITHLLHRHQGPIHKFEISIPLQTIPLKLDEWLLCLSGNGIRELSMFIGYDQVSSYKMPSSIYSCEKLTSLELFNCELAPPPPTFKGFLFLRVLLLWNVNMSPNGVQSVFANSPLLEELDLLDSVSSELKINAPNLRSVHLRGAYIQISLHAPRLAQMSVELYDNDFTAKHLHQNGSACNYTDFLGGFTNLEKLIGNFYIMKYLSVGIEYCYHSLVFPHLKVIELNEVNFENMREMMIVARLVIGAPNLQKLIVRNLYCTNREFIPNYGRASFMGFRRSAVNSTLEKLRVVRISGVTGAPLEMEFIRFLLQSSPVLEAMSFDRLYSLGTEQKQVLMAEMLGCTHASPILKFSFT